MDEAVAPKLTRAIIGQLMAQGMNFAQIGEEWGMTRQGVSWIWNYYGGETLQKRVSRVIPFKVPDQFNRDAKLQRLREHAEYMLEGNVHRYSEERRNRLRSFYKKLRDEDQVVEYDPNYGFVYRDREPRDKGLMIRVNEHTDITEYGETIWKLPTREP